MSAAMNSSPLSGVVIFPITRAQKNGLEDLRLVRFTEDDGSNHYYGTYTAYNGRDVGCEMLTTERFAEFNLTPLRGAAAQHKGLALFPRKLDGRYSAIGRLDHESLFFMQTDDRFIWNYGKKIMGPKYLWELVQMGNCGSPIELDEGWLVLTHGVGAMRQYSIGAALLDKKDPSKLAGTLSRAVPHAPGRDARRLRAECCLYLRHAEGRRQPADPLCGGGFGCALRLAQDPGPAGDAEIAGFLGQERVSRVNRRFQISPETSPGFARMLERPPPPLPCRCRD